MLYNILHKSFTLSRIIKNYFLIRFSSNIKIMSMEDTVRTIVEEGVSCARFGDGEFAILLNVKNGGCLFQKNNLDLAKNLEKCIKCKDILVCLPPPINKSYRTKMVNDSFKHWNTFFLSYYASVLRYVDKERVYGNAFFTRFWMHKSNKDISRTNNLIHKIKLIWDKKNILLVEGYYSKNGINNDLFANATNIRRIICPDHDAYNFVNTIYSKIIEHYNNDIVLLSLGPTATALVYLLRRDNIQAIDIGHIDSEYEWFKKRANHKTLIHNKHTAELGDDGAVSDDLIHTGQVIETIV